MLRRPRWTQSPDLPRRQWKNREVCKGPVLEATQDWCGLPAYRSIVGNDELIVAETSPSKQAKNGCTSSVAKKHIKTTKNTAIHDLIPNPARKFMQHVLRFNLLRQCRLMQHRINRRNISRIMHNKQAHIVAVFKERLIDDDANEFLKQYFSTHESTVLLRKAATFYAQRSVRPNLLLHRGAVAIRHAEQLKEKARKHAVITRLSPPPKAQPPLYVPADVGPENFSTAVATVVKSGLNGSRNGTKPHEDLAPAVEVTPPCEQHPTKEDVDAAPGLNMQEQQFACPNAYTKSYSKGLSKPVPRAILKSGLRSKRRKKQPLLRLKNGIIASEPQIPPKAEVLGKQATQAHNFKTNVQMRQHFLYKTAAKKIKSGPALRCLSCLEKLPYRTMGAKLSKVPRKIDGHCNDIYFSQCDFKRDNGLHDKRPGTSWSTSRQIVSSPKQVFGGKKDVNVLSGLVTSESSSNFQAATGKKPSGVLERINSGDFKPLSPYKILPADNMKSTQPFTTYLQKLISSPKPAKRPYHPEAVRANDPMQIMDHIKQAVLNITSLSHSARRKDHKDHNNDAYHEQVMESMPQSEQGCYQVHNGFGLLPPTVQLVKAPKVRTLRSPNKKL